jgi:hypothetical protein
MKVQEVKLRAMAKEDHVVASCRDPGDRRPAHEPEEDFHALESRPIPGNRSDTLERPSREEIHLSLGLKINRLAPLIQHILHRCCNRRHPGLECWEQVSRRLQYALMPEMLKVLGFLRGIWQSQIAQFSL